MFIESEYELVLELLARYSRKFRLGTGSQVPFEHWAHTWGSLGRGTLAPDTSRGTHTASVTPPHDTAAAARLPSEAWTQPWSTPSPLPPGTSRGTSPAGMTMPRGATTEQGPAAGPTEVTACAASYGARSEGAGLRVQQPLHAAMESLREYAESITAR